MELTLNQYSFLGVGLIVVGVALVITWRLTALPYALTVVGVTLVLLLGFQAVLSTNTDSYSDVAAFDRSMASGKPVLLVLYSNL